MDMSQNSLQLKNGSRIAIIGAGPAGCFFAHFALHFAKQKGIDVEIAIFDGKDFTQMGPVGCNMCAGVISETLVNKLAEQGLGLPEERVQRKIQGYYFQTEANTIRLNHPEGAEKITTVFRGNGPRFSAHNGNVSFDDFLLQHVKSQGVSIIQAPVQKLILPSNPTLPASLSYGRTNSWDSPREIGTASISRGEFKADLVVGAFGLNTTMLSKVEELGFGYMPPRGVKACQADIAFPSALIDERLQNRIVAINLNIGDVRVATITPKASHITISLLSEKDLKRDDLIQFLNSSIARRWLGKNWHIPKEFCQCLPKIAVSSSRQPFTDRFVIIGDASFSRYYKNGLESAFTTAKLAAETAFFDGISKSAFRRNYLSKAQKLIVRDNRYGRLLFSLNHFICKSELLTKVFSRVAEARNDSPEKGHLRFILWNMLTGNTPYRNIFFDCFKMLTDVKLLTIFR